MVWLVGLYFTGLAIMGVLLDLIDAVVLPGLKPLGGSDGVLTSWQVEAGLVGVALPFLFVLMPLVPNPELASTSSAELLMADTLVIPVLAFSLGGLAWTGLAAFWLPGDSAKWMGFVGVFLPTLVGVGFVYLRAARIIADPAYVRQKSRTLLLRRLDNTVVEQAAIEYANEELVDALAAERFSVSPFAPDDDEVWLLVEARRTGVLVELDLDALMRWIKGLVRTSQFTTPPQPQTVSSSGATSPDSVLLRPDEDRGLWCSLLGDTVGAAQVVLALRRAEFTLPDAETLATIVDGFLAITAA